MRRILTRMVEVRIVALVVLGATLLLLAACDVGAPPIVISSSIEQTVVLTFQEDDESPTLRFRKIDGTDYGGSLRLLPGTAVAIELASQIERSRYPLVISNSSGDKLFQRIFLLDEMKERDWKITITPEGIQ